MHRSILTFTLIVSAFCFCADAAIYTVDEGGGGDYFSIREAIEDPIVIDGDEIIVGPGTYVENIDFLGKAITVRSGDITDPANLTPFPGETVIDGGGAGSVVMFQSGEGADSVLQGFTITNGSANWGGVSNVTIHLQLLVIV